MHAYKHHSYVTFAVVDGRVLDHLARQQLLPIGCCCTGAIIGAYVGRRPTEMTTTMSMRSANGHEHPSSTTTACRSINLSNQPTVAGRVVGLVYAEADGRVPAKELRLEGSGLEGLGHTLYLGGRGQAFLGDILQCGEDDEWDGGGGGWMSADSRGGLTLTCSARGVASFFSASDAPLPIQR